MSYELEKNILECGTEYKKKGVTEDCQIKKSDNDDKKYRLTVSPICLKNKPSESWEYSRINKQMRTMELTYDQILAYTGQPFSYAIAPGVFSQRRKNEFWIGQSVFMLDFDSTATAQQVLDKFAKFDITPNILYYTFSHTPENQRFRVVLLIEEEITDKKLATTIRNGLLKVFPEADPHCKDAARMFLGGLYSVEISQFPIKLEKLIEIISVTEISLDNFQTRKLAEKRVVLSKYYSSTQNSAKNNILQMPPAKKAYLEKIKRNKFDYRKCKENVKIFNDFDSGEWLHYPQLFGLATNLKWIKGGLKYMENKMSKYNEEGKTVYDANCFSMIKYVNNLDYQPMNLRSFSTYKEDLEFTDLIDATKSVRGHVEDLGYENRIQLSEAEELFNDEFEKTITSNDNLVYLFKTQTGLGKSTKLTELKNVTLCFSTHKLKQEISQKMKVDYVVTPDFPKFECEGLQNEIKSMYSIGLNNKVYELLSLVADNNYVTYCSQNDSNAAEEYLRITKEAYNSQSTVLTTHQRGLFDLYNHHTIVFDEDPMKHLIPINQLFLSDLLKLESTLTSISAISQLINYLRQAEPGKSYTTDTFGIDKAELARQIAKKGTQSNLLEFFNSTHFIKNENDFNIIHYAGKRDFPKEKKIIIMSATAPVDVYKELFGDRLRVIDISNIQNQGEVIQDTNKSYSQYSISRADPSVLEYVGNSLPVITFKKHKDKFLNCETTMHFGNCEGYDELKGRDIVVVGTPHFHPIVYMLYATALGINVNEIETEMREQRVNWNNFIFRFMTYDDPQLRKIQLGLIESELIQAIGRARPLRTNAKVYVYSNLPLRVTDRFIENDFVG